MEVLSFLTHHLDRIAVLPAQNRTVGGLGGPSTDLSPDARSILYVQPDQVQNEIMVMENFR